MTGEKAKISAALAVILSAGVVLYLTLAGLPPGLDRKLHEAIGRAMAEEAIKLLGKGGRVTIIARDTEIMPNRAIDAQLKSLNQRLKKADVKIAVTKLLRANPLSLVSVPPGDFFDLIKKQTEGDVLVSFLGPAPLNEAQLARLGEKRPKVVAFCSGTMPHRLPLRNLFDQNLLHAAVISRERPLSARPASDSAQAWFDHFHQVITPSNLSDLPGFARER